MMFLAGTYRQNGSSMEVHSFMNWIEPPGSAEMSHRAIRRLGRFGDPGDVGIQGVFDGEIRFLASGMVRRRGV